MSASAAAWVRLRQAWQAATSGGALRSRAPGWVAAGLGLLLAVELVVQVRALRAAWTSGTVRAGEPGASRTVSGIDVAALERAHLFGVAAAAAEKEVPSSAALILSGVLAFGDPTRGMAILGQSVQSTKLYVANDEVPGRRRLVRIYRDHVVFEREDGTLESLFLPHRFSGGTMAGIPSLSGPEEEPESEETNPQESQRRAVVARVNSLVRRDHPHPNEIIRAIRNSRDSIGQFSGLQIFPAGRADIFESLGLQEGDLLVAVNNTELTSAQQGSALLASLGSVPQVQLTVIRDGLPRQIVVHTGPIEEEAQQAESGLASADAPGEK